MNELADPTTPSGLLIWAIAFGVITVIIAIVSWLVRLVVKTGPTIKKLMNFVDDVTGEEARPGVAARPGLMERMTTLEDRVVDVQRQVLPNHGSSLPDKVEALSDRLALHIKESEPFQKQVDELHEHYITELNHKKEKE